MKTALYIAIGIALLCFIIALFTFNDTLLLISLALIVSIVFSFAIYDTFKTLKQNKKKLW